MLRDRFGRTFTTLRIAVTNRCDLGCLYCRPGRAAAAAPRKDLLTFEEIDRLARVFVSLGVRRFRLTGGEPLLRRGLPELVARLAAIEGVGDLALTTNGLGLAAQAGVLRRAGLRRLNVSLDSPHPATFSAIVGAPVQRRVLDGLAAARAAGFAELRLNAVVLRGLNEGELVELVGLAERFGATLRLIELMPVGMPRERWERLFVPADEMIRRLAPLLAPGEERLPEGPGPARYLRLAAGGEVGIITCVSAPFCAACDRLRLTARGALRLCLASPLEVDLREPLRAGESDAALARRIATAALDKPPGAEYAEIRGGMCAVGG